MSAVTPPQLARRYGVSPDKVLGWIRRRELRAVNVATRAFGRPRWVIPESAIAEFEARRAVSPPASRFKRPKAPAEVIEFF